MTEGRWLDLAKAEPAVGMDDRSPGALTLGCQGTGGLRCSTSSCKLQGFFHVTSAFVFYGRGPEERLSLSPAARRISPPPTRRPQHPGLAGAHVPRVGGID